MAGLTGPLASPTMSISGYEERRAATLPEDPVVFGNDIRLLFPSFTSHTFFALECRKNTVVLIENTVHTLFPHCH